MDTPIRPLKGRELQARIMFLDDEISQLKKDINELAREGLPPVSHRESLM